MPHEKGRPLPRTAIPANQLQPENTSSGDSLTSGHDSWAPVDLMPLLVPNFRDGICCDEACENPVPKGRYYCDAHTCTVSGCRNRRTDGDTCDGHDYECGKPECENRVFIPGNSYCDAHTCTVKGCRHSARHDGMCNVHDKMIRYGRHAVRLDRAKRGTNGMRSQEEENEIAYRRLRANQAAKDKLAKETGTEVNWDERTPDAWEWLTSDDTEDVPLWGTKESPLWMPGESLLIAGPPGIGKSTLAHALVWGSLGLVPDVLGFPVPPMEDGRVLYLAMDRPRQIKRAMARFVKSLPEDQIEEAEHVIRSRITPWTGRLPGDIRREPELLVNMAKKYGATRIVVDSIKDVLPDASQEENAGGYNTARQEALTNGIQWIELHHNRKSNGDNRAPNKLDDVYGSAWLAAGAGSVISLFGQPGDIVARLTHLKSPFEAVNPMWVEIDPPTGMVSVHENLTPLMVVQRSGITGVTAQEVTAAIHGVDIKEVTGAAWKSKIQNFRNQLGRLTSVEKFEHEGQTRYRKKGELGVLDEMI
jgi:AAA domain